MSGEVTPGGDLRTTPDREVPIALAKLHHVTAVGADVELRLEAHGLTGPDREEGVEPYRSPHEWACALVEGSGFEVTRATKHGAATRVRGVRRHTLADLVGPGMRLLVCGLNPSPFAADAGIGFARPGNRFWPAALEAGIVDVDRDPMRAFTEHGIGFTDLVKRTTRRAAELSSDEYRNGAGRVRSLVEWLRPRAVCFVGLAGYRTAVDRAATPGWQSASFGSRPAYVMPNPSGINAHTNVEQLRDHLRAAVAGAS